MKHEIFKSVSKERLFNLSVFKHLEDNNASTGAFTVDQLHTIFSQSESVEEKGSTPLFNGTRFNNNTRQLESAINTDLLIFDLDGKYYSYNEDDLKYIFGDTTFFAYETASSNKVFDEQRWRIVIPLSRPVDHIEYDLLFEHFLNKYRLDVDLSTKKINAIFYLPEHIEDNEFQFISNITTLLNPNCISNSGINNTPAKENKVLLNTDIRLSVIDSEKPNSICGFPVPSIKAVSLTLEGLDQLTMNTGVGMSLLCLIGIDPWKTGLNAETGRFKSKALSSVLPWHNKDNNPSTGVLIKTKGDKVGRVLYRSFKAVDADNPLFDLHYVYACQQLGKQIPFDKWTRSTSLIWLVRALADAGVLTLPDYKFVPLPTHVSPGIARMYDSMKLLVKIRSAISFYDDDAIVFSFSFAEIWSGISRQTASKYFHELVEMGIVEPTVVDTPRMRINGFIPKFVSTQQVNNSLALGDKTNLQSEFDNGVHNDSSVMIFSGYNWSYGGSEFVSTSVNVPLKPAMQQAMMNTS